MLKQLLSIGTAGHPMFKPFLEEEVDPEDSKFFSSLLFQAPRGLLPESQVIESPSYRSSCNSEIEHSSASPPIGSRDARNPSARRAPLAPLLKGWPVHNGVAYRFRPVNTSPFNSFRRPPSRLLDALSVWNYGPIKILLFELLYACVINTTR